MNTKSLLEQLLQSGQQIATQGRSTAEQRLGVPQAGPERAAMLSGLGKGALAGGVLALLLGTGGGRRVTGSLLKYGSLAALGGVAFKAYQNWQSNNNNQTTTNRPTQSSQAAGQPIGDLNGSAADQRSLSLLKAMIAAAKADGHIDAEENARIKQRIQQFGLDAGALALLQKELDKPLDPAEIAAGADSPEAAAEIYLASLLVIDVDNIMERAYLAELAKQLGLSDDLVAQIEAEISG